jgi:hypothetical protein
MALKGSVPVSSSWAAENDVFFWIAGELRIRDVGRFRANEARLLFIEGQTSGFKNAGQLSSHVIS